MNAAEMGAEHAFVYINNNIIKNHDVYKKYYLF